jgi:2-dehydro-3-deoxygluconokinase
MTDLPAARRTTAPSLLAVGDPLLALLPTDAVPLDQARCLVPHVGGAELNTAIGVRRLGVAATWLGRVGDDPLGRRVLRTLADEGVDTSLAVVDEHAPTGLYLREWLPDGLRRPYYYRQDSAGSRLSEDDWPSPWPADLPVPTVLHVTGITVALSSTARRAVRSMIAHATALGCLISVDPNYRRPLWTDRDTAREALRELAAAADLLLLSEEDAELLFGTTETPDVRQGVRELGSGIAVFKRGPAGAVAWRGADEVDVPGEPATAVDPVGAGDGFNAGFLAATMLGSDLVDAVRCGGWCGARAVEQIGENTGYPRWDDLPGPLHEVFAHHQGEPWTTSR